MENEIKRIIDTCVKGALIATMAAAVRALLSYEVNFMRVIRTFAAGVILGALTAWLLQDTNLSETVKSFLIAGCGAFTSTIFPILEKWFKKYVQKKADLP